MPISVIKSFHYSVLNFPVFEFSHSGVLVLKMVRGLNVSI